MVNGVKKVEEIGDWKKKIALWFVLFTWHY